MTEKEQGEKHTDASQEVKHQDAQLEREPLNLETAGRSAPRGARAFLWLTILVAVAVAIGVLIKAWSREPTSNADSGLEADQSGITNRLKAPKVERPAPPPAAPPLALEPATLPSYSVPPPMPAAPPPVDELTLRRLASPLQAGGADSSGTAASQPTDPQGPYSDAGPLADKLRPLELA